MSITSDIRTYADSALEQGKQVLDQAQSQLNDAAGQANEFVGKLVDTAKSNVTSLSSQANSAVSDFRAQAEKAVNLEAIKTAVEPYLAQAKDYTAAVTDRAESLYNTVKSDPRVAKLVTTAEAVTGAVVETVQDRVVKPVQSLTGFGSKPAPKPTTKPTAKVTTTKPANTRPATKPATKTTARKAPAKKAPVAPTTDA